MDDRRHSSQTLRRVAVTAALAALLAPVGAAEAAKKKLKLPVVTSVSPMEASVGETITVRGRNFRRGKGKNSVVFKRDGARALFVKADVATKKQVKVIVPKRLEDLLLAQHGAPVPTRFRVRVLAKRFGKRFTSLSKSPLLGPEKPPAPPEPPVAEADGDCDGDGVLNRDDADDDNDLLSDELELRIKTDPCKRDTDGDGVEDGYEYRSAVDLNDDEFQQPNQSLPYPTKRPYPNPLDGADAAIDFDGDSLSLKEESALWVYTVTRKGAPRTLDALAYSDGLQHSVHERTATGRRKPSLTAAGYDRHAEFLSWASANGYRVVHVADPGTWWYAERRELQITDFNRDGAATARDVDFSDGQGYVRAEATYYDADQDGWLDDSERDEDADGLTNFDEARGCMSGGGYWAALYKKETPYPTSVNRPGTDLADEDSDGDGVRDGADDEDFDDLPNVMECGRQAASGRPFDPRGDGGVAKPDPQRGMVNPYNPCLPSPYSRTCNRNPALDAAWAPFNGKDELYFVWN